MAGGPKGIGGGAAGPDGVLMGVEPELPPPPEKPPPPMLLPAPPGPDDAPPVPVGAAAGGSSPWGGITGCADAGLTGCAGMA